MPNLLFKLDQASIYELLVKAIEIADEDNSNRGLYLQSGTYYARDFLNIVLMSGPTYLEDNLPQDPQ